MLKTAFIGSENHFDNRLCEWISEHSDLSLIIWTNDLSWASSTVSGRKRRVINRFIQRARKKGVLRAVNEFFYYVLYRATIMNSEEAKVRNAIDGVAVHPRRPLNEIRQIRPNNINSSELPQLLKSHGIDAMFSMCIDVYLPATLINTPKHGSFLWHEGFTPEYRGVYPAFWALVNEDYERLGYTLLRMNSKFDGGEIFLQRRTENLDLTKDWHSYIAHKSIVDSLPEARQFLVALEQNQEQPIQRDHATDGYYSYPTMTALLKLMWRRFRQTQCT